MLDHWNTKEVLPSFLDYIRCAVHQLIQYSLLLLLLLLLSHFSRV